MIKSKHWTEETHSKLLRRAVVVLTRAVELAYWECRDCDASHLHDDLAAAQWRLNLSLERGE